jgi:hypothetical protein
MLEVDRGDIEYVIVPRGSCLDALPEPEWDSPVDRLGAVNSFVIYSDVSPEERRLRRLVRGDASRGCRRIGCWRV